MALAHSPGDLLFPWRIFLYDKISHVISIFKNPSYADVAILSTLCLSFLVPATNLLGRGLNTFVPSFRGIGIKRALGTMGMRIYSMTMPLFIHGLSRALRQPLITEAMRHGINPFTLLRLGETQAQTNSPKILGLGTKKTLPQREEALKNLAGQKQRRLALASTIAFQVAADSYGQDPSLVAALANLKLDQIPEAKLRELIQDKKFRSEWLHMGHELVQEISKLQSREGAADLSNLSAIELGALFAKAKEICEDLRQMTSLQRTLVLAKTGFKNWSQNQLQTFANYGLDAVTFLKNGHPSNFVTNLFYTQFSADVALSVWQIPFVGARANLADAASLAGSSRGFLWTNSRHLGDMLDQVRIYNINAPSTYAMVYDYGGLQNAPGTSTGFGPIAVGGD